MKENYKRILPHLLVVLIFVGITLIYFTPVLQGKKLHQGDIVNYIGSAKEINDFRKKGIEPKWTNSMFGGMPAYMISVEHKHNFIDTLDKMLRFLPRPADYVFLYLISFYLLLLSLNFRTKQAFMGALAFGLSSYLFIILGAGHNSKANAIGYFPLVTAGILMIFYRQKYLWGMIISTLAIALEINANHYQMTYYLIWMLIIFVIIQGFYDYKQKQFKHFTKAIGFTVIACILALCINITKLWSTYEYSKHTIRGKSELTINPDKKAVKPNSGLDRDYITAWSYGKMETFNLFIPNFMGGGSVDKLPKGGAVYNALRDKVPKKQLHQLVNRFPTYWGTQPFTEGPAYIGAVVILFFIMGCFLVKGKTKWWLVVSTLFSIVLSWGKNMAWLTDFFIDYVPLYNKFRAVSSIQVIAEFAVPLLAAFAIKSLFDSRVDVKQKIKTLKKSGIITLGLCVFFYLFGGMIFSFESSMDAEYASYGLPMDMAKIDRLTMLKSDCLRAILFLLITLGVLYFYFKGKLKPLWTVVVISLALMLDLVTVNKRYVNNEDFVKAKKMQRPFTPSAANLQILKDKNVYRVFNTMVNPMQDASTSYFHHSIGGYHAAKLMRYQQLYDFHISKMNIEVLNMLNVKYLIQKGENNRPNAVINPNANGNAWVVNSYKIVQNADEEIQALSNFNSKKEAIVDIKFKDILKGFTSSDNSTASIQLMDYQPNYLLYNFQSNKDELAIFSEIYYPKGWNAYIDGKLTPHFRTNYVLRGLRIPKGRHKIEFKFEPQSFYIGDKITLASYILFFCVISFLCYGKYKRFVN